MERLFIDLIAALGINPNAALILGFLIFANAYLIAQVIGMRRTLKIHADHFDILDKDTERAKKHAHNAVLFSYKTAMDSIKDNL